MVRTQLIFAVCLIAALSSSVAGERLKQKVSPEQLKKACDGVKGEYFPQGQTGTFGCHNHKNGKVVLCNKSNTCDSYTATRTSKETDDAVRDLGLNRPELLR